MVRGKAGSVLPCYPPCHSALEGLKLVTFSLYSVHSDMYMYSLKEDGLKLVMAQCPSVFIFSGSTVGRCFGTVSLIRIGPDFYTVFLSRNCQTSVALNTRSADRRNEAQSPTHVGLLRFLQSPAANGCQ